MLKKFVNFDEVLNNKRTFVFCGGVFLSEVESVKFEAGEEGRLESSIDLASPIFVESGVEAAEQVGLSLAVVHFQVGQESRSHVRMIRSGTHTRVYLSTSHLLEPSSEEPDRENDEEEVGGEEEVALTRVLNLDRVQMHVVLGGEVTVQSGVDVLEFVSARVLVFRVGLGVGASKTATHGRSTKSGLCSKSGYGSVPHEEVHMWTSAYHCYY